MIMQSSLEVQAAVCGKRALKTEVMYFLITSLEEESLAKADFFFSPKRTLTPEKKKTISLCRSESSKALHLVHCHFTIYLSLHSSVEGK